MKLIDHGVHDLSSSLSSFPIPHGMIMKIGDVFGPGSEKGRPLLMRTSFRYFSLVSHRSEIEPVETDLALEDPCTWAKAVDR